MADREHGCRRAGGGRFPGPEPRPCAHPGCPEEGLYRAPCRPPRTIFEPQDGPPSWQYLCLAHVRAFNAAWNWFDEAAAGAGAAPGRGGADGCAGRARPAGPGAAGRGSIPRSATGRPLAGADLAALAALGLAPGAGLGEVRRRYRRLVQQWHPDRLGGDRRHEPLLQRATEAYRHLCRSPALRP